MQALCDLLFYNFYIIGVLCSAVHPMKYLESDVIWYKWCKGNVIFHFCLNDQSEKPMKISLRKLSPAQGDYQKVLSSTLNSLILTSKRVHLTLFQPLVTKQYHTNQYLHSTIVYIQQQQPISFLSSTCYGTSIHKL